jgi:hypothetical protein
VRPASIHLALLLAALLAVPATAGAQQEDRPKTGKVEGVAREGERSEEAAAEGGEGALHFFFDFLGALFTPLLQDIEGPAMGYLRYPHDPRGTATAWVVDSAMFGFERDNLSIAYYDDARATLQGLIIASDGTGSRSVVGLEYVAFREELADRTDWLHLGRLGIGYAVGGGPHHLVRLGAGIRPMYLSGGDFNLGWDLELGGLIFPVRPLSVSASFRGGQMSWDLDARSWMGDVTVTAGVHTGRVELQVGWRWIGIGSAPGIGGPTIGVRTWL